MTGAALGGVTRAGGAETTAESGSLVGSWLLLSPSRTEASTSAEAVTESGSGLGIGCCTGSTWLNFPFSWLAAMTGGSSAGVTGGGGVGTTAESASLVDHSGDYLWTWCLLFFCFQAAVQAILDSNFVKRFRTGGLRS